MFLTILGTGFNLLYWLQFKRRSFQSFKIPPSGQPPPQSFELLKIGSFKFPSQVPDFMMNYLSSKENMFKWREKGMVYGLSVISIILTYSAM